MRKAALRASVTSASLEAGLAGSARVELSLLNENLRWLDHPLLKLDNMGHLYASLATRVAAAARCGVRPVSIAGDCVSSLGMLLATALAGRWFRQRLGGFTGDTLGACQQLAELAALLGWLAVIRPVSGFELG